MATQIKFRFDEETGKPDWRAAPEWANYMAMDSDGTWFWYDEKPIHDDQCWIPLGDSCLHASPMREDWDSTLEQRPKCVHDK